MTDCNMRMAAFVWHTRVEVCGLFYKIDKKNVRFYFNVVVDDDGFDDNNDDDNT